MAGARHTVTFGEGGTQVEVPAGITLREAAALGSVSLDAPCGGLGTCGRCAVSATGMLDEPGAEERVLLAPDLLARGARLACRARVVGDVVVSAPASGPDTTRATFDAANAEGLDVEPPELRGIEGDDPLLGAAVDIGTTTLVVTIVDLRTGERYGSAGVLNPQCTFGHDVISRITHATAHGAGPLRDAVVRAVEDSILRVLEQGGFAPGRLRELAIAGNTTMIHLLLGIDAAPLATAPYRPAFLEPLERPAREIGFAKLADARAYVLPGISSFIGADITAGLLATRLAEQSEPAVLLDLGTNGEIVLRSANGLVGASAAAGPAFEGGSIACGMLAESGAIERVSLCDGTLNTETIGDAVPRGLCGSGLIDLIAALLDAGVVDSTGSLKNDAPHPLSRRVTTVDGIRSFEVADQVFLTQQDVRQVQLAVAAVAAGIALLLDEAGVTPEAVAQVIVAGGFGHHVTADALVRIGMVPPEWIDRVTFAGNTAQAGTLEALLDSAARRRAAAIAGHVRTLDLASHRDFRQRFFDAMWFPKT